MPDRWDLPPQYAPHEHLTLRLAINSSSNTFPSATPFARTGVDGLDDILAGGLTRDRLYLLEGDPGTGKTTIALQFLQTGAATGERCLYVTLSETAEEIQASAAAHGWVLHERISLFEHAAAAELLAEPQRQSLLYPSELELGETMGRILAEIERLRPERIVIDSVSEIRLLAQDMLRFRHQVLALKQYFAKNKSTVLILDDLTTANEDRILHSIAHGVVRLQELVPEYGADRRRLRVTKYRGVRYRGGFHDFTIETGGVRVYPRLVAAETGKDFVREPIPTGMSEIDELLGGGLVRGSNALITGPSGVGKSLLSTQITVGAMRKGARAAMYLFDEEIGLFKSRMRGMGIDLEPFLAAGTLRLLQIDPAELAPGAFAQRVRGDVEHAGAEFIVIDSLNGYQAAMPEEKFLLLHMHELLTYLNRAGAVSILTMAQHGLFGDLRTSVDITYLCDTLVLLRFFEAQGRVLRAISTVKNRAGAHENLIRELRIDATGIRVGRPLHEFRGVLGGMPEYHGEQSRLLASPPSASDTAS